MQHWIHNIAELTSLIIAIIYYPYLKGTVMKWFLPFLVFICSVELIVTIKVVGLYDVFNSLRLYDIVSIVEIIFYATLFYEFQENNLYRKIIKLMSIISVAAFTLPLLLNIKSYNYTYFGLIILDISLLIFALGYLFLKSLEDTTVPVTIYPGFWIAVGVGLFSAGSCIVFAMHDSLAKRHVYYLDIPLHLVIIRFLCILLYSSISIAIILCKKKTRISSLPS